MKAENVFWVIILVFFVSSQAGVALTTYLVRQKAAETSCAQYNPQTGDFEWLEELK